MDLKTARAEIEARFKSVTSDPALKDYSIICSGALMLPDELIPCLCITQQIAVDLWHKTFDANLRAAFPTLPPALVWRTRPTLKRFQMTMQGSDQQHRLVSERFAIYSEAAFRERTSNGLPAGLGPDSITD